MEASETSGWSKQWIMVAFPELGNATAASRAAGMESVLSDVSMVGIQDKVLQTEKPCSVTNSYVLFKCACTFVLAFLFTWDYLSPI